MAADSIDIDKLIDDITHPNDWINLVKARYREKYNKKESWQQVYEQLKERADKADIATIECIFWLDVSYSTWKHFDIQIEPIVKYLDMLPANKTCRLFEEKSELFYDYITQIVEPMKNKMAEMQSRMAEMQKEIDSLKTHIAYMPGGQGYKEAEHEFNSAVK